MPFATAPTRRFTLAGAIRIPTATALLTLTAACGQSDTPADAIFTPEVTRTTTLPPSENDKVALLADERTACVIDSYEVQVRCVDVEGTVVGVFGRKGEGPGEFGAPAFNRSLGVPASLNIEEPMERYSHHPEAV